MIPYSRPKRSDLYTLCQSKLLEDHTLHSGTYLHSPYIEDITRWREDMNFMFEWQEQYLTSERSEQVRYCSCHSNIKFISSGHRVISSMYSLRLKAQVKQIFCNLALTQYLIKEKVHVFCSWRKLLLSAKQNRERHLKNTTFEKQSICGKNIKKNENLLLSRHVIVQNILLNTVITLLKLLCQELQEDIKERYTERYPKKALTISDMKEFTSVDILRTDTANYKEVYSGTSTCNMVHAQC